MNQGRLMLLLSWITVLFGMNKYSTGSETNFGDTFKDNIVRPYVIGFIIYMGVLVVLVIILEIRRSILSRQKYEVINDNPPHKKKN